MSSQPDNPKDPRIPPPHPTLEQNKNWLESNKADLARRKAEQKQQDRSADASSPNAVNGPAGNEPPTVAEAFKSIKPGDFLSVHQAPCTRQGLMTGIAAGAAVGALRIVSRSPLPKAANWAVGSFILGSIVQYEWCQYRRREEKTKMKRVVEIYDQKQAEIRARKEAADRLKRDQEAAISRGAGNGTGTSGGWTSWLRFW